MTEPLSAPAAPPPKPARFHIFHFLSILLALAGFLVLALWPRPISNNGPRPGGMTLAARVAALEDKVTALESRVDSLGNGAPAATATEAKTPAANAPALARLQNDVVSLSAALDALQAEVRRGSRNEAHSRRAAQNLFAAAVAFMQLREAASSGHGFVEELAAMRLATRDDPDFAAPLAQIEPYALNGVPSAPVLYRRFQNLALAAQRAMDEARAQNWWQRILAEIRDVVIIHPVDSADGADNALAQMENDLAEGVVGAALDQAKGLPPAATETLKGWEQEAEARDAVDRALRQMADLLVASALPAHETAPATTPTAAPAVAPSSSPAPDAP